MSQQENRLYMAMELSKKNWLLCFGDGKRERQRNVPAGEIQQLLEEIAKAKAKFDLSPETPVTSCYEAGRDGFWIDRMLHKNGIDNVIMDPASIEVPRRARTRKTDRLDAGRLLRLLLRAKRWGEVKVFSSVKVPSEEQEAWMRIGRERERLVKERTGHRTRLRSLCNLHGITISNPARVKLDELRDWAGQELRTEVAEELHREQKRLIMVEEQIKGLETEQAKAVELAENVAAEKAQKLQRLKSIGQQTGWTLSYEAFGWRTFRNRRAVGSFAGLTGTPFDSGESLREQGISKAGNSRIRTTMIELAWGWVRWQPDSALTKWFVDRCMAENTSRAKRKAVVALARKLLVALWKYVEHDIVPEGAILKS